MSTSRSLALGATDMEVQIEGGDLAERWDLRYDARTAGPVAGGRKARLVLRAFREGPPLPDAWQPSLSAQRSGTSVSVEWPAAHGAFDLVSREGEFYIRSDVRAFGLAIEDVLRILAFELSLVDDVLLLHAAAVGPSNTPWVDVFAGRSGVGKTTLTERLVAAGEEAVSDDLVFAAVHEGRPMVLRTPFKGSTNAPRERRRESEIRAIALLRQAMEPSCRWLRGAEKLSRLLTAVVSYRPLEASEAAAVARLASALAEACAVAELGLTLAADPRRVLGSPPAHP